MLSPFLSKYDQTTSSDASIDPLGLYPIADQLASKLSPGFRERMRHPRFLTLMAAGAVICSDFDEDVIASDHKSEPWQIYEWYAVHSLVAKYRIKEEDQLVGLPGVEKAKKAYVENIPLNSSTYLKMPGVFGFHGVYRTLAKEFKLLGNYNIGEFGDALLRVWEKEEDLKGFFCVNSGNGRYLRMQFFSAINDSLKTAAINRSRDWGAFYNFAEHIAPYKLKPLEAKIIYDKILGEENYNRNQLIRTLESAEGQKIWEETNSEKAIHRILYKKASPELKNLLDTIFAYEAFARLLQNAFDSCLYVMTEITSARISKFKDISEVIKASRNAERAYSEAIVLLCGYGLSKEFEEKFCAFTQKQSVEDWVNLLFNHHETIQKNKPPNGRKTWFEKVNDDRFLIYPSHRRNNVVSTEDVYVHYYRSVPLLSFLKDLKRI